VGGTGYAPDRAARRAALIESGRLIPVQVEGIRGERFVVAEDLPFLEQAASEVAAGVPPGGVDPGVAFIAPLDQLCWDRDLLRRLFAFDYIWEVYVPEAKRRWGYYVLPILYGDRFVGRIEPRIERRAGTLRLAGMWWEPGFDPLGEPGFPAALARALVAHRDFAGLDRIELPAGTRHRPLAVAARGAIAVLDEQNGVRRRRRAPVGRCTTRTTTNPGPPSR
jgi:uncharacterized protein YcaQ